MCGKRYFSFLSFLFLALCFSPFYIYSQAAPAQERWFLISEKELSSIEEYKYSSEREKQSWLSQVQTLRARAERSERDSANLNSQLSQAREQNRKLEALFSESESEWLTRLSLKNGEIEKLKQEAAQMERIAADEKIKSQRRIFILVLFLIVSTVVCGLLLYRNIKLKKV